MTYTAQDAKALESRGFIPHTPATLTYDNEPDKEVEIVGYPAVMGESIFISIYETPKDPETRTLVNVNRLTPLI